MHLIVTEAFASYQRGDAITDADAIEAALETHPHHVVRVEAPAAAPQE